MAIHSRYNQIRFIGYQIPIAPVPDLGSPGGKRYLGRPLTEAKKDIKKRCAIMKNAIHIARTKITPNPKELVLFMAPEFYFRGGEGAYKEEHIAEIFREMRNLTKDRKKYGNWLFVLGTAVASHDAWWDPTAGAGATAAKEIWNVCMIQKGGFKRDDAGILQCCQLCGAPSPFTSSVIVYKEYVSPIDFVDQQTIGGAGIGRERDGIVHGGRHRLAPVSGGSSTARRVMEVAPIDPDRDPAAPPDIGLNPPRHARGAGTEMSKTGLGGQSVFMIDGITFGIEVCLDHYRGRLRQSPPASGQPLVQVHLIPSAGMDIEEGNVACMQNGYVFNVDGLGPGGPHTALKKRTGVGLTPGDFTDLPVVRTFPIRLKGTSYATVTHKKYFSDYGVLKIFDRYNLPAAQQQP